MLRGMLAVTMVAAITGALGLFGAAPLAAQVSAARSFSPATVSPDGTLTMTITTANYGSDGSVTETLPPGFSYFSSSLDLADASGQDVEFTLQEETSSTYTVAASSGDPLVDRYDTNNNGRIELSEVETAISDYFGQGADAPSLADIEKLIALYFSGPGTAQPAGTDLVVESPTVNDSSLDTGASFTLSATVRNRGSVASGSTTLRYYRSSDSTITLSDVQVGFSNMGAVSASESLPFAIELNAPRDAGTYYYGACVDVVDEESNTGNNCSDAVTLTVQ